MYRKRRTITIIAAIIIIAVVAIITTIVYGVKKIHTLEDENGELQQRIIDSETIYDVYYQVINPVKAGNSIVSTDVAAVEVPAGYMPENVITDASELDGMMYLLDLEAGTILTTDMITGEVLTDDMRELDIVFDELPIGIEVGDIIDVRISFPLGQDYIALAHKTIREINGNVVKMYVNEEELFTYESMKIDKALYENTRIYGIRYIAAGVQHSAATFYPVTVEVLKTMILNPNIDTQNYSKTLDDRKTLETQLLSEYVQKNDDVSSKSDIDDKFNEAKENYDELKRQAEEEEY